MSVPESNAYQDYFHMHHMPSHKDVAYSHPTFPGKGQLILGQEQEILCGGFDDTDSLSADIYGFEVLSISLLTNVDATTSKYFACFVSLSDLSYVADLDVEPYSSKGGSGRTFQLSVIRFKWQGYLLERIPESMDHV